MMPDPINSGVEAGFAKNGVARPWHVLESQLLWALRLSPGAPSPWQAQQGMLSGVVEFLAARWR